MSQVYYRSDEPVCLNLGLSPMKECNLSFALLTNNSEAFLHIISPAKAFATETVNVMIQLLNTSMLGCNFEF